MFPFVTPCCHNPLPFRDLDEIQIIQECEEGEEPVYHVNSRCCFDYETDPGRINLKWEREEVYKATIQHQRDLLESKVSGIRADFFDDVERFAEQHDPSLERFYTVAFYGLKKANSQVEEFYTKEEAIEEMGRRANILLESGYEEIPNTEDFGVCEQRTFSYPLDVICVGWWSTPYKSA